ncbi:MULTISPECIES: DUF192 domain-containing protein [unclassified Sphingomonas]|jgi:uncharacterized membrane protein (UPF0127 family)|uniref:DUF192 domain-containing protein n=1 Tax=unclassified Sphingomonas TaxID=196159 RepID=UPI0025FD822E|nr:MULTISPECIES: DUF192 domain-containing protein [unclassified Sphingomonas]
MSARVKAAKAAKAVGAATAAALLLMATGACSGGDGGGNAGQAADASTRLPVTITGAGGSHVFLVERAVTAAQQAQGLMYRTDLTPDGGMLFHPYPAGGGAPREASFWMKNTPTPLDILFIRADGTIATIAENTVPYATTEVKSREPVAAVLEIVGGRAAELGIAEGDRVTWAK